MVDLGSQVLGLDPVFESLRNHFHRILNPGRGVPLEVPGNIRSGTNRDVRVESHRGRKYGKGGVKGGLVNEQKGRSETCVRRETDFM